MKSIKTEKPIRSFSGEKWITNHTNKKYLAEDFKHRCAYCDDADCFNGYFRNYHVEHFAPKDKFPALEFEYSNLLYACPYCNGSKSNKWPSSDPSINVVGDVGFLDPCDDEYYNHLHREDDGSIGFDTKLGEYIYNELNLGLKRHKIIHQQMELDKELKALEEKIKLEKSNGGDASDLELILGRLSFDFYKLDTEKYSCE